MLKVMIDNQEVGANLEVSEEEAQRGIYLGVTSVRIDMAGETYHAQAVAKLEKTHGSPQVIDIDCASAARNFYATAQGPFTISHLVTITCGEDVRLILGETFCNWAGIKFTSEQRTALDNPFPIPDHLDYPHD